MSVDFTPYTKQYIDAKKLTDDADVIENISREFKADWNKLNSLWATFTDSISEADYKAVCLSMSIEYNEILPNDSIDFSGWTKDMIEAYLDSCAQEAQSFIDSVKQVTSDYEGWFTLPSQFEATFGTNAVYSMKDCSEMTPERLVALGYESLETTEGNTIYILTTDSVVTYVNFEKNVCISIRFSKDDNRAKVKRKAVLPETFSDVYEKIAQAREIVNTIFDDFMKRLMLPEKKLEAQVKSLEKALGNYERYLKRCNHGSARWKYWTDVIKDAKETLSATKTILKYTRPLLRFLARCVPIADYLVTLDDCYSTASELASIYATIPDPCPNDQANANWCKAEDIGIAGAVGVFAIIDVVAEITGDVEIVSGAAGALATAGTSLVATGWGIVQKVAAQIGKYCLSLATKKLGIKHLRNKIAKLKCQKKNPPTSPTPPTPPGGGAPHVMDPSGYVYEGVSSNRLEGVTATVFYKETVEDMYGDLHENIVKWDASEYAQENPLFTNEYGMYAWDVPNGLWQVKFEKEGYETTYSDWLPVPPPQLDVNIAMKQNRQPEVKSARAYEDAVEVEFDKYMMPELLTTDNISVIQNGTPVKGAVELLNEEASYEGEAETFASKLRFNAAVPFTEQEITLVVSNRVKSYAGIRMQDDYQQTFTTEQEIKQIVSDSLTVVGYGEKATLTVSVLPASASKGKTLTVKTSSPMILGVETQQVVIGNDGKAEIIVSGELPGTAALTFSVDGTDKTALTIASVEQKINMAVATPTASIASGSTVDKGTKIELSCATEGATIYYTLDGSCPCDNTAARKVYDGTPIVINETTTIKAMAVAADMTESEVAEFTYIISSTGVEEIAINDLVEIYPLPVRDKLNITAGGNTIQSVSITSMNGVLVASHNKSAKKVSLDVSNIPANVYIITIVTDSGSFCRKILKVQ